MSLVDLLFDASDIGLTFTHPVSPDSAGVRLRWIEDGIVHACESGDVHDEVRLIWTLCHRDVPERRAVETDLIVTCPACRLQLALRAAAANEP